MGLPEETKTLVQCDFDGTITEEDQSFLMLDAFANGDWRQWLRKYRAGEITVGDFNTKAFTMIKADRPTLVNFIKSHARLRAGFNELVIFCRKKGFRFVIVSNGLYFYIEEILKEVGLKDTEIFAAQSQFMPEGVEVKYIGPDGHQLRDGFKEAYTRAFLKSGYRVAYVGNGLSDIPAAKLAQRIFAVDDLLAHCKKMNIDCVPYVNFSDVIRGLELWEQ